MKTSFVGILAMVFTSSGMAVTVSASAPSPAKLGSLVTFQTAAGNASAGQTSYRFRARRVSPRTIARGEESFHTIVDFGPKASLEWTTIQAEGVYEIEGSVLDRATGEMARSSIRYEFSPLAGMSPVVTATAHPLIFIYSAPPCPEGARMRVEFEGGAVVLRTPYKDCDGRFTMNFYLAGMRAASEYRARHTIELGGAERRGPMVSFTTGIVSLSIPAAAPMSTPVPEHGGILLHSILNANPIATDLNGNLIWYGPAGLSLLTRVGPGGTMLGVFEDGRKEPSYQTFREFDLAGVTVAETNAQQVSDQLAALGLRPITSFHHEAVRLPDGKYLVLAGSEQLMEGTQGEASIDLLGDTILALDRNLQVEWVWDSFDHMDLKRAAILSETCAYPASLACAAFYQAKSAHDWLHGNSLQLTPDGNILYSVRHQDWVVKIDYRNGSGSGEVLWRLGAGGDFQLTGGDESLWFSHQHDAQLLPDGVSLLLFDNGNTRIWHNADQGSSRGQLWRLDEERRTATLVLNADLGVNSSALGTAQLLPNGNYHFDAGSVVNPASPTQRITRALEVDASGNIVWGMQMAAQEYRNFRLQDLYTPPDR
jgi:arylsulfate sulfotransferase